MGEKNKYCYEYPHPALTVDAIIFTFSGNDLKVLLIQRAEEPFKNRWVFPGGFVEKTETVEKAVKRELLEETSLRIENIEQVYTASAIDRDPRGWTVSTVFIGFVNWENAKTFAGDDAKSAEWVPINKIPSLAFDHDDLLQRAIKYLKKKVRLSIINPELLPSVFLLQQLQTLYFQVTGSKDESEILIQRLIDFIIIKPNTYSDLYSFDLANYKHVINYGFIR